MDMDNKYICNLCNYQASNNISQRNHQQSVHKGKHILVRNVIIGLNQKNDLSRHQQSVHMGKNHPCGECGNKCTRHHRTSAVRTYGKEIPMW